MPTAEVVVSTCCDDDYCGGGVYALVSDMMTSLELYYCNIAEVVHVTSIVFCHTWLIQVQTILNQGQ